LQLTPAGYILFNTNAVEVRERRMLAGSTELQQIPKTVSDSMHA
jgi:hypothetical protein